MAHDVRHLTIGYATRPEVIDQLEEDLLKFARKASLSPADSNGVYIGDGSIRTLVRRVDPTSQEFWLKGSFSVDLSSAFYVEVVLHSPEILPDPFTLPKIAQVFNKWREEAVHNETSKQEDAYMKLSRKK